MNSIRLKCFLVLLLLSIIGFGPLSVTALIGMYVVLRRPEWFLNVVCEIYRNVDPNSPDTKHHPEITRTGSVAGTRALCFLGLALLMVLDIAPVPVVGGIGLYIVIRRPRWFMNLVSRIYDHTGG